MEVLLCNNYLKGISFFGALFLTSQQYFDLVFLFTYFIELYIFNYHIVLTNRTIVKTTPKDRVLKKRLLRIFFKKNNRVTENFHIFDTDMKCAEFF